MNKSKRLVLIISVIVFIVLGTTGCGQKNQNEDVINKCEILDGIDEKNELAVDNVNEKISNSEISKENRLFEGKYVCDNKELEPSNGEGVVNVILEKDNQFIIELLFDGYYSGTYKVWC